MCCYKCKKEENIKEYVIKDRGYGSIFDNDILTIRLCDNCATDEITEWINEDPKYIGCIEKYEYENNLNDFLESLDIDVQEKIFNSTAITNFTLNPNDWIAWKKGEKTIEEIWEKLDKL